MELSVKRWNFQPGTGPGSQERETAKIVLLHGMGGTGSLWRPVAASLENEFSLLAPDQRGHGSSQIPAPAGARNPPRYSPLEYGQDVIDTMAALEFHPAWIIGHSMGVRSACAAAHLRPEWVSGLILVDLGFSGAAGGGLGDGLASFLTRLPMLFPTREAAREFMARECPDPAIAQYLIAVSTKTPEGMLTFPFDKAALIQTIYAAKTVSVRGWVRELGARGMPILVLRGAKSLVWNHLEYEAERAQFEDLPSIRFEEVQGAGHGLPFEQRAQFAAMVREFVLTGKARPGNA